jgi:hypothetical protein
MSENFQHKILNFEIVPPKEVWNKILLQLDEEVKVEDSVISQKIYDYEIIPPAFILQNVLSEINTEAKATPPSRIFKFPMKRVAIAAVAIGVMALALFYFVASDTSIKSITPTAETTPTVDTIGNKPLITEQDTQAKAEPDIATPSYTSLEKSINRKSDFSGSRDLRNGRKKGYKTLNLLLSANAAYPISVYAPPICDDDGNIILDEDLISAPDDNYIIVTSPNGEQTKVSRKFLKMLIVMNGQSINGGYFNAEGYKLKARFEEWRSKLLQQASYIPTANNFLDIVDLKDMLQEN